MIHKLLYQVRRRVLVWRLDRLSRKLKAARYFRLVEPGLWIEIDSIQSQLNKLDATEISKGEAHVIVR